jgi:hypothetical protein
MAKTLNKATRPLLVAMILLLAFATYSFAQKRQYSADAWSFGVMGDTQWTLGVPGDVLDPSGKNPNFISESIARQIKDQLVQNKVKFIFQLGDSSNWAGDAAWETNAINANHMYWYGVGYFPMRGNHDTYGFYFGLDPDFTFEGPDVREHFPQTQGLANTFGTTNFSSPTALMDYDPANIFADRTYYPNNQLQGLSYSFDYNINTSSARFVVLDTQWTYCYWTEGATYPTCPSYNPGQQQDWITERLNKATRGTTHAFVLSHQNLMGTNHTDSIFGSTAGSKSWAQNPFYASMKANDVKFYITAHDHLYNRSIIKSPNGLNEVEQIISQGASTKFYYPAALTSYKTRETELAQELGTVGFYVYTVDGPRVNVDYYSDATGNLQSDYCYPYGIEGDGERSCANAPDSYLADTNDADGDGDTAEYLTDADGNLIPTGPEVPGTLITPKFNFVKKESFGYSLNGKEVLVPQGGSYAGIQDSYGGTTAQILGGTNGSTAVDGNGRPIVKKVNTGWSDKNDSRLASNILSLWGMTDFGSKKSDVYVLSMAYEPANDGQKVNGYRIATIYSNSRDWLGATRITAGYSPSKAIKGPWNSNYGLGYYGYDPATNSAWAVLDYVGDFAVLKY